MATTPQFIASAKTPTAAIVNGTATAFLDIMTAGASGSRIDSLSVVNTDASNPYTIQLAVSKSGTDFEIGEVVIPAGAGTNGTAKAVAALNPTDVPMLTYTEAGALFLEAGAKLRARAKTTVSGVNALRFVGVGGDY